MLHILGIRHHGPGSAKSVKSALERIQPDCILVEGPPDGDDSLVWINHKDLKPPVALLVYNPDNPSQAGFYPFAEFSPEWQAISFALKNEVKVRYMDLPLAHKFAMQIEAEKKAQEAAAALETENATEKEEIPVSEVENQAETEIQDPTFFTHPDPLTNIALAAGFEDGEEWWEHHFEYRNSETDTFTAVMEVMQALRQSNIRPEDEMTLLREAYMRKIIRQAQKEGFQNIAIVCGAWHAPALADMPTAKADEDLLKKLPKVKAAATWVPWTYDRLSFASGYGAGIHSPGWYEHIWTHPSDEGAFWLAKVAHTLRADQMDVSVAHVIETVRLGQSLSALREVPRVGLKELNEAIVSVMGMGDNMLLKLVRKKLIVGEKIGKVPADAPKTPLQSDFEQQQKKLKLQPSASRLELELDLRKTLDLNRSIFLHRLLLLGIEWGKKSYAASKGTFKEKWILDWNADLLIQVIEKGIWGNSIAEAAMRYCLDSEEANTLPGVSALLPNVIPADLPQALEVMIARIEELAASTADLDTMMDAIPNLANLSRHGSVRMKDTEMLQRVTETLIIRTSINLPPACVSVKEDAARIMAEKMRKVLQAIQLLQQSELTEAWNYALRKICVDKLTNAILMGTACRMSMSANIWTQEELEQHFYAALSSGQIPAYSAQWLEGFLQGSGSVLLLDDTLWNLVDGWVKELDEEQFLPILPLLRRTFSTFAAGERRKIGEKAKDSASGKPKQSPKVQSELDEQRAEKALPIMFQILGL